jgi:hypothetical protein
VRSVAVARAGDLDRDPLGAAGVERVDEHADSGWRGHEESSSGGGAV